MTRHFARIFLWQMLRPLGRRPGLALLNILSIGLGIAVYLAIQIANHTANRSFEAGIDLVAGKAQLEIRGDVDETLWPTVAAQLGIVAATGIVEGLVTFPDRPGEYLRIVGVDLFSGEPFRTFAIGDGGKNPPLEEWMGAAGSVALTAEFARQHQLEVGREFSVIVNSEVRTLKVAAILTGEDSPGAVQSRFAVMDIGWAQELLGRQGRLSSIQLLLDEPAHGAEVARQLSAVLPAGLQAEPPRQRGFQIQSMLSAFQLNLTALSMVSLLVGVFLIYNTVSASVARRRVEIGTLRAMGATRGEIRALFLAEACLVGAIGIVIGLFGGVVLARLLTGAVAKTISSLYLLLSIDRVWIDPWQIVLAVAFGLAAVLVGAWKPASEAAAIDPVNALGLGAHAGFALARAPRLGRWGLLALIGAAVTSWLALVWRPPAWGFVAAFLILCAFALFSPAATWGFGQTASAFRRAGILWRLAADHLRRSIHRNAVTVAALAAAIAMMVGLMVMIHSFRGSVDAWISRGIVADLFIAPASNETIGLEAAIPPPALAWLRARPEVAGVDTFRELTTSFEIAGSSRPGESARLSVVEGEYRHNLTFLGGEDDRKMAQVFQGGAVAITEPLSRKARVRDGDKLVLTTPRGPAEFVVAGTYADYTRDQGGILISRANFDRWWSDPRVQSLAIYLRPGADGEAVAEAFRAQFSTAGEFAIYSNRALRQRILVIFDQTFAVTYVLRTMAILVALAGIYLSVTTLVTERRREIGVLRAVGASRGQVQRFLMIEAGMIGAVASFLGIVSGALLAMVLTWVVNPAFFGWTFALRFPWLNLAATPLWIIPVALLAAWLPAWQACRTPISEAVREE